MFFISTFPYFSFFFSSFFFFFPHSSANVNRDNGAALSQPAHHWSIHVYPLPTIYSVSVNCAALISTKKPKYNNNNYILSHLSRHSSSSIFEILTFPFSFSFSFFPSPSPPPPPHSQCRSGKASKDGAEHRDQLDLDSIIGRLLEVRFLDVSLSPSLSLPLRLLT